MEEAWLKFKFWISVVVVVVVAVGGKVNRSLPSFQGLVGCLPFANTPGTWILMGACFLFSF